MSPWSWFLLPTLRLLPASAAPPRGAPASANCKLKPQVRRAAGAGAGAAASRHLLGVVTFPTALSPVLLDPEPTQRARLPPCTAAPPSSRFPPSPRVPLSGGGAELRPHETLSPSPRHSSAEGSPAPGLPGLASLLRWRLRDESLKTQWARDLGTFTLKFVLPARP